MIFQRRKVLNLQFFFFHLLNQKFFIFVFPRSSSVKHLVANYTERKEVSFGRIKCSFKSLGSHVGWCTNIKLSHKILFPNKREAKIAYFPCRSRFEDIWRFQVSMKYFHFKKILIARDDLFHYAYGHTFAELLMLLDETV